MIRAIIDHLMSLQRAAWIREFDHEQFSTLNRERARLAEFLAAHYGEEVSPDSADMRTIVEVAIRHLRVERERWTARLADWALRMVGKPKAHRVDETGGQRGGQGGGQWLTRKRRITC